LQLGITSITFKKGQRGLPEWSPERKQIEEIITKQAKCILCAKPLEHEYRYKNIHIFHCNFCNIGYKIRLSPFLVYSKQGNTIRFRVSISKLSNDHPRRELVEKLGGMCSLHQCQLKDPVLLDLHHINGGGNADRKRFGSQASMWRYYLNHLDEAKRILQVLCANHHRLAESVLKNAK